MIDNTLGAVTQIWRYPVSSCGGESLGTAAVGKLGLEGDRSWSIVDVETEATINPSKKLWHFAPKVMSRLSEDHGLELSVDGGPWRRHDDTDLLLALKQAFGRDVAVHRYGTRLARQETAHRYALAPIHLVSLQALQSLGDELQGKVPDVRRFRPNLVVNLPGLDGPCPEEALLGREFWIGDTKLRAKAKAGRCSFVTLEQQGLPTDRSVLSALLAKFDRNFGIYCEVLTEGTLSVGQPLHLDADQDDPIIIVGGGQAAGSLARELRTLGDRRRIKVFCAERHAPYERPALSKSLTAVASQKPAEVLSVADSQALGIDLHLGQEVVRVDRPERAIQTADGSRHLYSKLVFATGGTPRMVPLVDRGHGRVHRVRTRDDAVRMRAAMQEARKIFIVGNGWLGLELAAASRVAGIDATVFCRQPQPCSKVLPLAPAEALLALHVSHGTQFLSGPLPDFVEYEDRVEARLDGAVQTADLILFTLGISPNDHLARSAGLVCDDGIVTDLAGTTSDPNILAIGDVARQVSGPGDKGLRIESEDNAISQAHRAARHMLGLAPLPARPARFWSEQFGLRIQIIGMPDPSAIPVTEVVGTTSYWEYADFAIGFNAVQHLRTFEARFSARHATTPVLAPSPAAEPVETLYLPAQALDGLPDNSIRKVVHPERGDLVVARISGNCHALQDRCPHSDASLSEGILEGERIICPLHFAEFSLLDGRAFNAPAGCPNSSAYRIELNEPSEIAEAQVVAGGSPTDQR